jgi:hypothetical protein
MPTRTSPTRNTTLQGQLVPQKKYVPIVGELWDALSNVQDSMILTLIKPGEDQSSGAAFAQ